MYVCIFASLALKAVHLEVMSDLTSKSFIATLQHFIACRRYHSFILSNDDKNFVGANRKLKELYEFLTQRETKETISEFCTSRKVECGSFLSMDPILVDYGKLS